VNYLLKRHGLWEHLKSLCPEFLRRLLKKVVFKRSGEATMDAEDRAFLIAPLPRRYSEAGGLVGS
jgi:hypothetical protein